MVKAILNGTVIADSDKTVYLEGNHYFPPDSANQGLFSQSSTKYTCPWKGDAVYYNANVDGRAVDDVAWGYPKPKEAAKQITGYIAFDKSKVKLEK